MPNGYSALVLDSSVALKWFLLDEDYVSIAGQVKAAHLAGTLALVAPDIIVHEVGHGLLKAARQRRITVDEARSGLSDFIQLGLSLYDSADLSARAFTLAAEIGTGYYDGLYATLSQATGLPALTSDGPLFRGLVASTLPVLHVRDYA